MRMGLSVYGTTYGLGIDPRGGRPRIAPVPLLEHAHGLGLEGAEIPLDLMEGVDPATVVAKAEELDMFVRAETNAVEHEQLIADLQLAAKIGSPTLRTIIRGAKIGGDRRPLAGKWREYIDWVGGELEQALPVAKDLGMAILLEDHQDIASEEILEYGERFGNVNFGMVLDTSNAMATVEEPIDFARRMSAYIKHVHLKDYKLYWTDEGYLLVRCAAGQGYMDFPAIFQILSEACPDVAMTIEVGALEARHVRMLSDDFWPDYPARTAAQLAQTMRFALAHARPAGEDWRTPFEKGESAEAIMAYEDEELAASIAHLTQALNPYQPHHQGE